MGVDFSPKITAKRATERQPAYPHLCAAIELGEKLMITLSFPDGNKREFDAGVTGLDVATSIAKSLANKSVAM